MTKTVYIKSIRLNKTYSNGIETYQYSPIYKAIRYLDSLVQKYNSEHRRHITMSVKSTYNDERAEISLDGKRSSLAELTSGLRQTNFFEYYEWNEYNY